MLAELFVNATGRDDALDDVRRFLENGSATVATRNALGETALQTAAMHGQAAVVALLLERGADPNAAQADGATALLAAAFANRGDIVRTLLARGARVVPNKNGATALHAAAARRAHATCSTCCTPSRRSRSTSASG